MAIDRPLAYESNRHLWPDGSAAVSRQGGTANAELRQGLDFGSLTREFPQFGKSLSNVARTWRQVFNDHAGSDLSRTCGCLGCGEQPHGGKPSEAATQSEGECMQSNYQCTVEVICEVLAAPKQQPPKWFKKKPEAFVGWHCELEVTDCVGNTTAYGMFGREGTPLGSPKSLVKKSDRLLPRNPDGSFANPWAMSRALYELDCPGMCSPGEDPCAIEDLIAEYPTPEHYDILTGNCVTVVAWTLNKMGLPSPFLECDVGSGKSRADDN